jgi:hypothetical protein
MRKKPDYLNQPAAPWLIFAPFASTRSRKPTSQRLSTHART